ncbi:MAG: Gfo/Idh/MocA family oxidoreductase [Candidatus Bathyarchaeota archaeon]|nr:Gfo/Idh/MocA family oxidoreductase [Candidatus Bathyarchaeota archaeon]
MPMKRFLNIGVIGVGTIGKHHIQGYTDNPKAKVVAISDVNTAVAKSVASDFGVKKFLKDYRDLLDLSKVDAVSICTPPFAHAKIACDAAKAGKHVLCEKPMAMNADEAEKMVEACKEAGVKLGICSSRSRFGAAVESAREYVQSGKLGKVYYVRSSSFRRLGRPGLDILKESKWFLDSSKAGGGSLIDIGCYDLDGILYILGGPQPAAVSAMTFRGVGDQPTADVVYDVEEHASLMVRFEDGLVATVETAWASNMDRGEGIILFGTKGGLKVDGFTFYTEQEGKQVSIKTELPERWGERFKFIDDFLTACLEDKSPKTPGEDGLKVMQIISMAYLSAELRREVTLKDLGTHV